MEIGRENLELIAAQGLAKRYGSEWIFEDVSFALRSGESVRITGPNGSGKSTVMRIVAGLSPSDQGSVDRGGTLAYAGHSLDLYESWTARQNLEHFLEIPSLESSAKAVDAINAIGLAPHLHKRVAILSQGNKQRINILLAILSDAQVWILDEPLNALDVQSVAYVREKADEHCSRGGAVLWSGHAVELSADAVLELGGAS